MVLVIQLLKRFAIRLKEMISSVSLLTSTLMLSLGGTLILWTFGLVMARSDEGEFTHFFRMFVGFLMAVTALRVFVL